jgi:fumarylacetoacetate (FAA) hydrolase family protein
MKEKLAPENSLPADRDAATLVGRAWLPGNPAGPSPVLIRADGVHDLGRIAPTMSELLEADDPVGRIRQAGELPRVGDLADMLMNSAADGCDLSRPFFLAPADLQAVKAAGVTFIASMLERVVEEQARGDAAKAETVRKTISNAVGSNLAEIVPGSDAAMRLKQHLIDLGAWSQYLEVGIGPDAEIFTKAQPMSAVGTGAEIGIHPGSGWNNPEPEVVLAVNSRGTVVGATLGNDVNLRDFEGRSALLLSKAKDNTASCALGPFIRLFDGSFTVDHLRSIVVELVVEGPEGFRMEGRSSLRQISRDPLDLVAQTLNANHQYPDGFVLFLGTMFAPVEDRDEPGGGFTHKVGDVVTIRATELGALINRVNTSDRVPRWTFGTGALMRNLAARKLI